MRTRQIFHSEIARRVDACVNMTGNKKARRDAGLFVVLIGSPDQMMHRDQLASLLGKLTWRAYLASLAICAVRRETLRLALFL